MMTVRICFPRDSDLVVSVEHLKPVMIQSQGTKYPFPWEHGRHHRREARCLCLFRIWDPISGWVTAPFSRSMTGIRLDILIILMNPYWDGQAFIVKETHNNIHELLGAYLNMQRIATFAHRQVQKFQGQCYDLWFLNCKPLFELLSCFLSSINRN
jgi:hypothetical protein